MNYEHWVHEELEILSKSLGFRYTPLDELENRLARLRQAMDKEGLEGLLVVQKMACYYLSGTAQDGLLFVPLEGKPLLMVRREVERARVESALTEVVAAQSIRNLPSLIHTHYGRFPKTIGVGTGRSSHKRLLQVSRSVSRCQVSGRFTGHTGYPEDQVPIRDRSNEGSWGNRQEGVSKRPGDPQGRDD